MTQKKCVPRPRSWAAPLWTNPLPLWQALLYIAIAGAAGFGIDLLILAR